VEDAEILIVAYGLAARIAHRAVDLARSNGIRAGLLRPITLFPFPEKRLRALSRQVKGMLTIEMNAGQMVEDVRLAANGKIPVEFYGRMGGMIPTPEDVLKKIMELGNYSPVIKSGKTPKLSNKKSKVTKVAKAAKGQTV